jgi:hypothetical protein
MGILDCLAGSIGGGIAASRTGVRKLRRPLGKH